MPEREQLKQAIAAMEAQRAVLGDAVVDVAIAAFRARLESLPEISITENRKTVTILIAEVSGLQRSSDKTGPLQSQSLLNSLWETLEALVLEHHGVLDQRSPTTLTAVFGIPETQQNDPERAAWAALAMQQTKKLHPQKHVLRIGMHTADLLFETDPSSGKIEFIGDELKIAARLQKAAGPGEIFVSQDTYLHLQGIFDLQTLDPLLVRGRSAPIQVYRLRSGRARALNPSAATSGLQAYPTELVGRSAEMQTLQDAYLESCNKKLLNIGIITGEVGIGKTRLAREFCAQAKNNPLILNASCTPEDTHTSFTLLRKILMNHYQLDVSAPPELIRTRLENEFRTLLRLDGIEAAHLLGQLAGFDFSSSPLVQRYLIRPQWGYENTTALRQRALSLCPRFFRALAGSRPLIICLDNLQWTDSDSLSLIDALVNEDIAFPTLILCLSRPSQLEDQPSQWISSAIDSRSRSWKNLTRINLEPLPNESVSQLAANVLRWQCTEANEPLPDGLLDALRERANGNPFFVLEMLRMWVEDHTLQCINGSWQIQRQALNYQKMPSSLTEIMQARLDSLPIPERDLIKRAAIIGRIFWIQSLQALAPHTSEDTGELVNLLVVRGLIAEQPTSSIPGCQEYTFTHTLLFQVTYDNVLLRIRPGYHARAADWLREQAQRLNTNAYAAMIAEQYEKAGQGDSAALWYEFAGDYASERHQSEIALKFYQKSLQIIQHASHTQRLQLLKKIGNGLWWMANYAQAAEIATAQAEIAQAAQENADWAEALNRLSAIQNRLGDHKRGLEYANQSAQIARQANALPELASALFYRGVSLYRLGNNQQAQETADEALQLNIDLEKKEAFPSAGAEIIRCLNLLGMISQTTGNYQAARDYFTRVLKFHRKNNNPSGAIAALNNLGVHAHIRGEYKYAIENYRQALEEAREVGYRDIEWICLSNLSGAQAEIGEYKTAEIGLRLVLENAEASGWFMLGEAKRFMALALLGQRRRQEALEFARDSLEFSLKSGGREYIGRAWRILGMIAAQSPTRTIRLPDYYTQPSPNQPLPEKNYTARDCFTLSQEIFQQINGAGDLARTRLEWSRFEYQYGDQSLAQQLWDQALAAFEHLEMQEELRRMHENPPYMQPHL